MMIKTVFVIRAFCEKTDAWIYRFADSNLMFGTFAEAQLWANRKKAEKEAKYQQGREVCPYPYSGRPDAHVVEVSIFEPIN